MDTAILEKSADTQSNPNAAVDIQELSIVLVAQGLTPNLLSPDFFVYSGVVPRDWQLARQPVVSQQVAQLVFQNGISIVVEPGKVTFSESISTKSDAEISIVKMATKVVEAIPQAEYQAIGINPKRIVTLSGEGDRSRKYLTETLLSPGKWQHFGQEPMQASLNLSYGLEDCRFQLGINPTQLRMPNEEQVPGILFAGNFHYELTAIPGNERQQAIYQALANWPQKLATYRSLLDEKFLPATAAA